MGSERIIPARSARFWLGFVGVIIAASLLAFGIAYWATNTMPAMPTAGAQDSSSQVAPSNKVPDGPKVHDTLGKQKELERS